MEAEANGYPESGDGVTEQPRVDQGAPPTRNCAPLINYLKLKLFFGSLVERRKTGVKD